VGFVLCCVLIGSFNSCCVVVSNLVLFCVLDEFLNGYRILIQFLKVSYNGFSPNQLISLPRGRDQLDVERLIQDSSLFNC